MSKKRRQFTDEFKAEVVMLCQAGDRTCAQVARDLGLVESVVNRWVQKANAAKTPTAKTDSGELTGSERDELARLRKEVSRLKMEREILKKAAAFFASESL
jgi:transposase